MAKSVILEFVSLLNLFWFSCKFRYRSLPGKNCSLSPVSIGYITSKLYWNWVEHCSTQSVVCGKILGLCRLICSHFCYGLNSKYYIIDTNSLWKYLTAFEKTSSNVSSLPRSFTCLMKPDNMSVDCVEKWQNNFTKIEATSKFLPLTWYKIEQLLSDPFFSICGKHCRLMKQQHQNYAGLTCSFLIRIFLLAMKLIISVI